MKKSFKIIALLLAIAIVALSLCSCRSLDEAKENRGVYSDDHLEITFKGEVYRFFDPGDYAVISDAYYGWTQYHATDKGIPLLLAGWFGDTMSLNKEKTIIETSAPISTFAQEIVGEAVYDTVDNQALSAIYGGNNVTYIRGDLYDATKAAAEADKLECYYLEYYERFDYDFGWSDWKDYNEAYSDSYRIVILDDDAARIVDNALKTPYKDKISYKELGDSQLDIPIGNCDKNKILRDWSTDYHFVKDQGKYYFWNGSTAGENCLVPLDEHDSEIVSELFDQYDEAVVSEPVSLPFEM